jgi:hypothetical protein
MLIYVKQIASKVLRKVAFVIHQQEVSCRVINVGKEEDKEKKKRNGYGCKEFLRIYL